MKELIAKVGQAIAHKNYPQADQGLTQMMENLAYPGTAYSLAIRLKRSLKLTKSLSKHQDHEGTDWMIKTEFEKLVQEIVGY